MPPRTSSKRAARRTAPVIVPEQHPSYWIAAIVLLVIFALYVATLAPATAMWDTSEYIAAARVLGIPHPPGNPFFVLIGLAFGLQAMPSSVATTTDSPLAG